MGLLYTELLLKGKVAGQVGAGDIVQVLRNGDPEEVFHTSTSSVFLLPTQR